MNERIIELAHEVFSFKYKTSPYELNPGHHMDHLHKFAELIIEEAFLEMARQMFLHCETQASDPGYKKAVANTKKKFGLDTF